MEEANRALQERIKHNRRPVTETIPLDDCYRCVTCRGRRQRSLQYSHYTREEKPLQPVRETGAYVPELSARLEDDPNLTDGARRCARKIAEYTYRHHRQERAAKITVSYLATALKRSRRTIQRYLRQLERGQYMNAWVVSSPRTRMSVGLLIALRGPLFPKHQRHSWPQRAAKSGATGVSHNKRNFDSQYSDKRIMPRETWAFRCAHGVFRSLIATLPPLPAGLTSRTCG
jgi:hypothetical protein